MMFKRQKRSRLNQSPIDPLRPGGALSRSIQGILAASSILAVAGPALRAHDSPEHTIHALTGRIEQQSSPILLVQRATEWQALNRLAEAKQDLKAALALDPQFVPAQLELCEVQLALGNFHPALAFSQECLASETLTQRERAAFQFLRAQLFERAGSLEKALAASHQAMLLPDPPVDWPLLRSQLQARLGQHQERIEQIHRAWQQNGSFALQTEWIEALLDGRRWAEALSVIEPQLTRSKWQSSWLIRRARAYLGQGQESAAKEDLRRAVAEINQRLDLTRPDLTLLADRARAHQLLGQSDLANRDLSLLAEQSGRNR